MTEEYGIPWITLNGPTAYATRFVKAPVWTWEAVPGAAKYEVHFAQPGPHAKARVWRGTEPRFDMASVWSVLDCDRIDMVIVASDATGREILTTMRSRAFWKVPGWDGMPQEPLNYTTPVCKNMEYLLAPARDEVKEYERGLPRCCWSSFENNITGRRGNLAYPAIHHPSLIFAFLAFARAYPEASPETELPRKALEQARQYGDWLLEHRQPPQGACGLFPFSTISQGRYEGGNEGKNITLFRAARVGEAMLALHDAFGDAKFFDYACHLAEVFVKLQSEDGSWPYRVNPLTGEVVEQYTSSAITPAHLLKRLAGRLDTAGRKLEAEAYAAASERAVRWVLENPVKTRLWQGAYEDVDTGHSKPYKNLQNWDVNETIRFLVEGGKQHPEWLPVAEELNEFIEDQFVVWREEISSVTVRCPTPAVLEQYTCYHPMEVHTGHWLRSLLALHRGTGKQEYLDKAVASANAIVRGQQKSGAFSTWGFDQRFGRELFLLDWPGCNAVAAEALLQMEEYLLKEPATPSRSRY